MFSSTNLSYLDRMLKNRSPEEFRNEFLAAVKKNRNLTIRRLNDDKLQFISLFILIPQIQALNLYEDLSPRNIEALKICAVKLNEPDLTASLNKLAAVNADTRYKALKWMFATGLNHNIADSAYDAIMDAVVALLLKTYDDKMILPTVANLIFERNRKGYFIHDLVWSFFQAFEPSALEVVAKYLLSDNADDVELAKKLLHLKYNKEVDDKAKRQKQYKQYLSWLGKNKAYLYKSGEYFQLTSDPNAIRVDMGAKYLNKNISYGKHKLLESLTEDEANRLDDFYKKSEVERRMLAEYSSRLHSKNIRSWQEWMQKQASEQVAIAKQDLGVMQ